MLIAAISLGGLCFLVGLILLAVRLAARRSSGGVAIAVVLVLLLIAGPLAIFCLLGALLFGWTTLRSSSDSGPLVEMSSSGPQVMTNDDPILEKRNRAAVDANKPREIGKAMQRFGEGENASLIDGLNWFPEESTACASYSFSAAPVELSDALWSYLKSLSLARVAANQPASPIAEIADSIGNGLIARVSYALVEDPAGQRTRHFVRLSGLWNRDRVIQNLTGKLKMTRTDLPTVQGQKVTIVRHDDCAIAVIGSTDLALARFDKKPAGSDGHESAIRELLACKESRQRSLRNGPLAVEIAHTPGNSFMLLSGELGKETREPFAATLAALPRKITIGLAPGPGSGTSTTWPQSIESPAGTVASFRATMRNKSDAETLAKSTPTGRSKCTSFSSVR